MQKRSLQTSGDNEEPSHHGLLRNIPSPRPCQDLRWYKITTWLCPHSSRLCPLMASAKNSLSWLQSGQLYFFCLKSGYIVVQKKKTLVFMEAYMHMLLGLEQWIT